MRLKLDDEVLRLVWASNGEIWFSGIDYLLHSVKDLACDDSTSLLQAGFVPFLTISNEELIRAYIRQLENKKLSTVLDGVDSKECVELFWKYHNAYESISSGFEEFEKSYVTKKVIEWCDENAIEYKAVS